PVDVGGAAGGAAGAGQDLRARPESFGEAVPSQDPPEEVHRRQGRPPSGTLTTSRMTTPSSSLARRNSTSTTASSSIFFFPPSVAHHFDVFRCTLRVWSFASENRCCSVVVFCICLFVSCR
ncbi:hypothetical protein B296_00004246, partial [Ensete ventricosum]